MESAAQDTGDPNVLAGILPQITVETVANHCGAILKEYEKLADYMGLVLTEISVSGQTRHSNHPHELPRPSGLPSPDVSLLQNMDIPMPGPLARLTSHGRERHFRTELAVKAGDVLQKALEELRPRLHHWLSKTFAALEDDYHSQTDPLRYRNAGQDSASSGGEQEELQNDILFLRGQMIEGRVYTGTCK